MVSKKQNASKSKRRSKTVPNNKLDQMIEEAIVDAYGDSEQTVGFYTMLEDNLAVPFETEILGIKVTVDRIDMTDDKLCRILAAFPHDPAPSRALETWHQDAERAIPE
jgi:hypothetical protein